MWQKFVPEKKHCVDIVYIYIYVYTEKLIYKYLHTYRMYWIHVLFLMFFVYLPAFTITINHSWIGISTTSHGSVMG